MTANFLANNEGIFYYCYQNKLTKSIFQIECFLMDGCGLRITVFKSFKSYLQRRKIYTPGGKSKQCVHGSNLANETL